MPKTKTSDRTARRRRLIELLESGFDGSQDEIVQRLASEWFTATQATVSRDLDDVGAVRAHSNNGKAVYVLPERNGPPTGFGKRVIGELVRETATSGNMIVIRTFPGMAATVAAVLDQSGISGILGTIAGDDTVFVVADEKAGTKRVVRSINEFGVKDE
jgi:transcriptional regulator of arginine metabolism